MLLMSNLVCYFIISLQLIYNLLMFLFCFFVLAENDLPM